jgi:mRNA-degrading endonuclease RelE of RelBE toxin-antitoxin system
MELKFKGQFNRDIDINNRHILEEIKEAIANVKSAKSISLIRNLKKLRNYQTHYRIKIAEDYRIGIIVRGKTVWFARFGHRNLFYNKFP